MEEKKIQRLLGYGRVSTEAQEDNFSLSAQRGAFEADCERNGWKGEFLEEVGSGTSIAKRPILRSVLEKLKKENWDALWLKEPDRLTRPEDLADLTQIRNVLLSTDTKLIMRGRMYDLKEDSDVFFFNMDGVFADFFRRQLLRNMKRGKDQKASEGRKAGGRDIYGYFTDEEGRYQINVQQAKVVRRIFLLADEGFSIKRIQKELERLGIPSPNSAMVWGHGTIADLLKNQIYLGIYKFGKHRFPKNERGLVVKQKVKARIVVGTRENPNHEPIVSPTLFDRIQEKLKQRRTFQNLKVHMATGILSCPKCGTHCSVSSTGSRVRCYRCQKKCGSSWLPLTKYDPILWDNFKFLLTHPNNLRQYVVRPVNDYQQELKDLKDGKDKVQAKLSRLLDLYLSAGITRDQYDQKKMALEKESEGLGKEVERLGRQRSSDEDLNTLSKVLLQIGQSSWKWTPDQKTRVFRSIVKSVQLKGEEAQFQLYLTPVTTLFENRRRGIRDIKVARTIADLEASATLATHHLAEAIGYRQAATLALP